jgi:hypothetical protein
VWESSFEINKRFFSFLYENYFPKAELNLSEARELWPEVFPVLPCPAQALLTFPFNYILLPALLRLGLLPVAQGSTFSPNLYISTTLSSCSLIFRMKTKYLIKESATGGQLSILVNSSRSRALGMAQP